MSAPAGSPHPAAGARMPPKLGGAVSGLAPPQQNGEARGRGAARGLGRREGEGEGGRAGGLRLGSGRAGPGPGGRGETWRPRCGEGSGREDGRAGLSAVCHPGLPFRVDRGRGVGVGGPQDSQLRPRRRLVAPGDPFTAESSQDAGAAECVVCGGHGAALVLGGSHPSGPRNVALIFFFFFFKARELAAWKGT